MSDHKEPFYSASNDNEQALSATTHPGKLKRNAHINNFRISGGTKSSRIHFLSFFTDKSTMNNLHASLFTLFDTFLKIGKNHFLGTVTGLVLTKNGRGG